MTTNNDPGLKSYIPKLRFKNYSDEWQVKRIDQIIKKVQSAVKVVADQEYREIGIRSHGKGIFHKQPVMGSLLGNKRVFWVENNVIMLNIVFAWEQALAKTSDNEKGMIASHRFPMYIPINNQVNLDFLLYFFLRDHGKYLLELASPGGAGRNKTLGQKAFDELKLRLPKIDEQQKIAAFLSMVNLWMKNIQDQINSLESYKKSLLAKIFSQQMRFKDENGKDYLNWNSKKLSEILIEHKTRNVNSKFNEVLSVAKTKGVINQKEHLGRSYASTSISNYKVAFPFDVIYTKSPTADFPFGIIKQNRLNRTGVVSVLYAVFKPINDSIGTILEYYFLSPINTFNYLNPLAHKGAKNTMNIGNDNFLNGATINLPNSEIEQQKLVNFLTSIDKIIESKQNQLNVAQIWKKGLFQQMFV